MIGRGSSKFWCHILLCTIVLIGLASAKQNAGGVPVTHETTGTLEEESGTPLPAGKTVTLTLTIGNVKTTKTATTKENGKFTISLQKSGRYTLSVEGFQPISRQLPNKDDSWSFYTQKLTPINNAPADLKENGNNTSSNTTGQEPASGTTPAGENRNPPPAPSKSGTATGAGPPPQRIRLNGRVVDQNGTGIGGVQITIEQEGNPASQAVTTETADSGAYEVDLAGKGTYKLSAQHENFSAFHQQIKVETPNQQADDIQLRPSHAEKAYPQQHLITIMPARKPVYAALFGWFLAGLGIVAAVVFQIWTLRKGQIPPNLAAVIYDLKASLVNLENSLDSLASQPPKEAAGGEKPSDSDAAVSKQPGSPEKHEEADSAINIGSGGYPPILPEFSEHRVPRTLVELYEQARTAPDQERAIQEFRRDHSCTRLSLINAEDVDVNPSVHPEFTVSSAGWFLGVESDGQMLCFPWFSLDFSRQMQTFQKAFNFQGNGSLRVTSAARLSPNGKTWTLAQRGCIESTL